MLRLSLGDPVGHAVAIAHARHDFPEREVELHVEPGAEVRLEGQGGEILSDDPMAIAERLARTCSVARPTAARSSTAAGSSTS